MQPTEIKDLMLAEKIAFKLEHGKDPDLFVVGPEIWKFMTEGFPEGSGLRESFTRLFWQDIGLIVDKHMEPYHVEARSFGRKP